MDVTSKLLQNYQTIHCIQTVKMVKLNTIQSFQDIDRWFTPEARDQKKQESRQLTALTDI